MHRKGVYFKGCITCKKLRAKYRENPEEQKRRLEANQKYRTENREKWLEKNKKYRQDPLNNKLRQAQKKERYSKGYLSIHLCYSGFRADIYLYRYSARRDLGRSILGQILGMGS